MEGAMRAVSRANKAAFRSVDKGAPSKQEYKLGIKQAKKKSVETGEGLQNPHHV